MKTFVSIVSIFIRLTLSFKSVAQEASDTEQAAIDAKRDAGQDTSRLILGLASFAALAT